eukprot:TRINITY_DN102558_c0_g1_i1.p1 TRINITY_DN102558_c0_g1~~TRINITY_DN102558_c0_g1_i1.p1  ORF type:complete len:275 (-),score=31.54 TRINITY_DN102558_c0_g1_i1:590-1378(-)
MVLHSLALVGGLHVVSAVVLNDTEDGAPFTKCVGVHDFEAKTLLDNVTLQERNADGCCPPGTLPGAEHVPGRAGAQIVCGFSHEAGVKFETNQRNFLAPCTYSECYINKQNVACLNGTQRLNGCCAEAECSSESCGFGDDCTHVLRTVQDLGKAAKSRVCATYHKDWMSEDTVGTDDDDDDFENTSGTKKMLPCNVFSFASCSKRDRCPQRTSHQKSGFAGSATSGTSQADSNPDMGVASDAVKMQALASLVFVLCWASVFD